MYFLNRLTGGPRHGPPDPPTLVATQRSRGAPRYCATASPIRFDFPDLPWPRVRRVQRVPVLADRLAVWQHARADPVHEGIPVDRHEVVLVEHDLLDRLDQPLALGEIEARLVLLPQRLDLRLADEGRRAVADRVDRDVVL